MLSSPLRQQEYGVGIFNSVPTKSALKKGLKKKLIRVDVLIASSAIMIQGGEQISLVQREEKSPGKKLVFPLIVLFEDEHLAVVQTCAGLYKR